MDKLKNEKIFDTIKIIIEEIKLYEGVQYSDIKLIGEGSYSCVFSIGTKVLKLGKQREVFYMENNKRFLKPILRTEIKSINSTDVLGCIEITEKVNTDNITEEDAYIIYRELRDKGYFWLDCSPGNLGRTNKKNKIYFKDLNPTKEATGYLTDNNEELDEEELVIIDNDYIYTEEQLKKLEKGYEWLYGEVGQYEDMYQKEKTGKIKFYA